MKKILCMIVFTFILVGCSSPKVNDAPTQPTETPPQVETPQIQEPVTNTPIEQNDIQETPVNTQETNETEMPQEQVEETPVEKEPQESSQKKEQAISTPANPISATDNQVVEQPAPQEKATTVQPGTYQAYSAEAVSQAIAQGKDVALFFHASFCGSCKLLDKKIQAGASTIPSNTALFKIDYESNTQAKDTYNVNTYHTIVYLDASGKEISREVKNTLTLEKLIKNWPGK